MEFSENINDRDKVQLVIEDAITECIEKMTLFRDIEIKVKVYSTSEPKSVEFLKIKYSEDHEALISGVLQVDTDSLVQSVLLIGDYELIRADMIEKMEKKVAKLLKGKR